MKEKTELVGRMLEELVNVRHVIYPIHKFGFLYRRGDTDIAWAVDEGEPYGWYVCINGNKDESALVKSVCDKIKCNYIVEFNY